MFTLAMQHSMLWVSQGLMPSNSKAATRADINNLVSYSGAIAQSPSDASPAEMLQGDLDTAKLLGKRVAELAVKFRG
jgi:NAD(P)H dehydrogenase (quinone)